MDCQIFLKIKLRVVKITRFIGRLLHGLTSQKNCRDLFIFLTSFFSASFTSQMFF